MDFSDSITDVRLAYCWHRIHHILTSRYDRIMGEQVTDKLMTDHDKYFAMIGAILLHELHNSRELRRKIKGTKLEYKLLKIMKP